MLFFCLVIVNFFLYLIAPSVYSHSFCVISCLLFCANALLLYREDRQNEKIGFNLIFTVAFFIMLYIYPIFIRTLLPDFSFFNYGYNEGIINKCTAFASLFYSLYSWSYHLNLKKCNTKFARNITSIKKLITTRNITKLIKLDVVTFVVFLLLGGLGYLKEMYLHEGTESSGLISYVFVLVQIFNFLLIFSFYLFEDKKTRRIGLSVVFVITIILLFTGYRTQPLIVFLTLFYIYYREYKFNVLKVAIIGAVGVVLMVIVGLMRADSDTEISIANVTQYGEGEAGIYGYMEDFMAVNYNYYVLCDYVDNNGILWGENLVTSIFSVVPFAQRVFMVFTGEPEYKLSSPQFATRLVFGDGSKVGLGTDIIGDAYLAFGLLGVIICAIFLGYIVVYFRTRYFKGDLWGSILYLQFVGGAIYLVRSCIIGSLREYVWSVIIVLLIIGTRNRYSKI